MRMGFAGYALLVTAWCGLAPASVAAPPRVVHFLPFPAGRSYQCWRSFGEAPSHDNAWSHHAADFSPMAVGSPIVATAPGEVVWVKEDTSGPTGNPHDNNGVAIRHDDGTVSKFLHIRQDGAVAKVGDRVARGDLIAYSGNTGMSEAAHLHFAMHAGVNGKTVPFRIHEVGGDGVPRAGQRYTSHNVRVRGTRAYRTIRATADLYAFCRRARCLIPADEPVARLRKLVPLADREALREVIAERDALVTGHGRAGTKALKGAKQALAAGDLATAVRLTQLGVGDYGHTAAGKALKRFLLALHREDGFATAYDTFADEREYRRRFRAALRSERTMREKMAKLRRGARRPRTPWRATIRLYRKALPLAPAAARSTLEAHIAQLAKQK